MDLTNSLIKWGAASLLQRSELAFLCSVKEPDVRALHNGIQAPVLRGVFGVFDFVVLRKHTAAHDDDANFHDIRNHTKVGVTSET